MKKPTIHEQKETLRRLSQTVAAEMCGVSVRQFQRWDAPRNADGTYSAPALLQWMVERAKAEAAGDPLLVGSDSPSLERYRAARADMVELELQTKRGQLLDLESFYEWWGVAAGLLRRRLEMLQRLYGAEAAALVTDGLDDLARSLEERRPT